MARAMQILCIAKSKTATKAKSKTASKKKKSNKKL
jgi:hypothetical protein